MTDAAVLHHVCRPDAAPVRTVVRADLPVLVGPETAWLDPYGESTVPVSPPTGRWGEYTLVPHDADGRLVTVQRVGALLVVRGWGAARVRYREYGPVPLVTTRPYRPWGTLTIFREIGAGR